MQIYMQAFVSNITNGKTETDNEWYAQDCGVLVLYNNWDGSHYTSKVSQLY